ncbi:MAG TPA: phosphoribosyltransferase family protein, partial [Clostridia bacterium]|nr:phosphoribosyltransferase family protein [Clostridia bacterium]
MAQKTTKVLISKEEIACKVKELGRIISEKYKGKTLTCLCILKGAVIFYADLIRELDCNVRFEFMAVSSYGSST